MIHQRNRFTKQNMDAIPAPCEFTNTNTHAAHRRETSERTRYGTLDRPKHGPKTGATARSVTRVLATVHSRAADARTVFLLADT
jgi:hypothetical protein